MINIHDQSNGSAITHLRSLIPPVAAGTSFTDALRLAERQAIRFLEFFGVDEGPVSEETVLSLPNVKLRYHQLSAASGLTYWNGRDWIIGINSTEPLTRQRFTIFHEFKHIIDHGSTNRLYSGDRQRNAERQAELAADYFSGCVLMPSLLIKRAWFSGTQRISELASLFDVSQRAIEVRLDQLSLRGEDLSPIDLQSRQSTLPSRPRNTYLRASNREIIYA